MATEVVAYGASTTPTIKALSFFPEASSLLAVAYAIVALPHSLFPIVLHSTGFEGLEMWSRSKSANSILKARGGNKQMV